MNYKDTIEAITEMVDRSLNMPFSGGKALMDVTKLAVLIDDLRSNIPTELEKAKAVLAERDRIIATAKREADNIIKLAQDSARAQTAQQEVLLQARERARELTNRSESEAAELRKASHTFADNQLESVEQLLDSQLAELKKLRQALKRASRS